jgi:hypothetical protein
MRCFGQENKAPWRHGATGESAMTPKLLHIGNSAYTIDAPNVEFLLCLFGDAV